MKPTNLPPLPVVGPTGEALTLRSLDRHDTVASLSGRLGVPTLAVEGRTVSAGERLADIDDLRVGARLTVASTGGGISGAAVGPVHVVDVRVVSGPCVTTWRALPPGRHLVGRASTAAIHLDDPVAEPHHVLLAVDADGHVEITQLTGSVPIRRETGPDGDRTKVRIGASVLGVRPHRRGGARGATGSAGGSVAAHPSDPWRRIVWRAPYAAPTWNAPELVVPPAPADVASPSATGLVGVGATALGAVGIAIVIGNAMFLLFAAMGVFAATATFVVGHVTARRSRRRRRADHDARVDAFRAELAECRARRVVYHRDLHRCVDEIAADVLDETDGRGATWRSRPTSLDDPLVGVVGRGTVRWAPEIRHSDPHRLDPDLLRSADGCAHLDHAAAPVSIAPGDAIAFHGPARQGCSVVRSILVQLASSVGPADWRLVVVSSDRRRWEWTRWLPHGAVDHGALIVVDPSDQRLELLSDSLAAIDAARRIVVVTDEPQLFTARTGPLRRFLATTPTAASLVVVDTDATVPSVCRRVLTVGSIGTASWSGAVPDHDAASDISFHGISLELAERVARRLACLVDPEDDGGVSGGVPTAVTLSELVDAADRAPTAIAERWRHAGADPSPVAPIGTSADGRVDVDLVRDGPHGLIAGTTGSGKSELLRTLVVSLAVAVAPEHLNFVLVDYKGGSTFDACADLPHTVGMVTDLDDGLAERALASLDAELHRRERMLREVDATDLTDYRTMRGTGVERAPIARLVVVIDEFAALAKELPHFLAALVDVAQRGRSLGVHLLLATQRPAGVVNDDIRANTNLRLALRLHDSADALDVVADTSPAAFPRGVPGRAALRLGPDEIVTFQSARCSGPYRETTATGILVESMHRADTAESAALEADDVASPSELRFLVDAVRAAASSGGHAAPHRPWTEPLPFPLTTDRLHEVRHGGDTAPIGWIDDPANQCRRALTWTPGDGSLALVGSPGSGTTSTLIALATSICRDADPGDLHLYVVDSRGDERLDGLASIAHCGGVVRVGEEERLHRVLQRVVGSIDRRMSATTATTATSARTEPRVVLMIDGLGSLRASLAPIERQATFDLFQRVLTDAASVGIALVVVDDGTAALAHVPVAERWLFHVDDPAVASAFGARTASVPDAVPGRLRIVGCGSQAQVAQGAVGLASLPSREATGAAADDGRPLGVEVLSDGIDASSLGVVGPTSTDGSLRLALGRAADDLSTAFVDIVAGDHLLVVGGPRSGVSTTVTRCVEAWRSSVASSGATARVVQVDRRHPIPDDLLAADASIGEEPTLLVIDDAHRVDDPGCLTAIVRGDHPHVTVIAGARADAVRTSYGHWTREIAKLRCGLVLTSRGDPDGDLLGVQLPRRSLVPARPGLAWIVDGGPLRLAQIAVDRA